MSNWNILEQSLGLLETIADNSGGSGGSGTFDGNITKLGGNNIAVNQGVLSSGVIRTCVAENDVTIEKRNSTFYTYNMLGGVSRQIVNAAYVPFAAAVNDLPSTDPASFRPSFVDLHIVIMESGHDDQAGDSARSVLFEYYDSSNAFQSVTELLGADTTFSDVRRIVTFKVITWGGTNKYNYGDLYIMNLTNSDLVGTIPAFFNTQQRFQQEIPLNGKIFLDQLEVANNDTQIFWVRIYVRKYDGTNNYDQIIFGQAVPSLTSLKTDLSSIPAISGPADYNTENISVYVAAESEGTTTIGSANLSYHFA